MGIQSLDEVADEEAPLAAPLDAPGLDSVADEPVALDSVPDVVESVRPPEPVTPGSVTLAPTQEQQPPAPPLAPGMVQEGTEKINVAGEPPQYLSPNTIADQGVPITTDWWREQAKESLKEDWRRTQKFVGTTLPAAAKSAWEFQGEVGSWLSEPGYINIPKEYAEPYGPGSSARDIDQFLARDPEGMLRAVGHGIAPWQVRAPGPAPQVPFEEAPISQLSAVKDAAFNWAVEGIRAGQHHIGAPVANAILDPLEEYSTGPVGSMSMLAARQAAQFVGGEEVGPDPDKPYALEAANQGDLAIAAQMMGEVARQLPFFLFTSGVGARLVKVERGAALRAAKITAPEATVSTLAKLNVRESGAEGLAQGVLQTALTPGTDVLIGPVAGVLLGALAGKAVATPLAKNQTMAGFNDLLGRTAFMPAQTWEQFTGDLGAIASTARIITGPKGEGFGFRGGAGGTGRSIGNLSVKTTKIVLDTASGKIRPGPNIKLQDIRKPGVDVEFKPVVAMFARNEAGARVGREVMVSFEGGPGTATITLRDTPIDRIRDTKEWFKGLQKDGITGLHLNRRGQAETESFDMLLHQDPLETRVRESAGVGTPEYMAPEESILDPRVKNKLQNIQNQLALKKEAAAIARARKNPDSPEAKRLFQSKTGAGNRPAFVMPKAAPKPVAVAMDSKGRMRAVEVTDPPVKASDTWRIAPGDLVQAPDGSPYIVVGFDDNGRVYARLPGAHGGKGKLFDNASLKFLTDAEGRKLGAFEPAYKPQPQEWMGPVRLGERGHVLPDYTGYPNRPSKYVTEIIKELGTVTVPRVSKSLGVTPGEAAQIIIAHDHLLIPDGPGVYKSKPATDLPTNLRYEPWGDVPLVSVGKTFKGGGGGLLQRGQVYAEGVARASGPIQLPKARLPGLDNPVESGTEVYFGHSRRGRPLKGVIRGPDPRKPGNYFLETFSPKTMARLEEIDALKKFVGPDGEVLKGLPSDGRFVHRVSVPMSKLRTVVPVNLAKPALQKLFKIKGLYGMTTPHPPQFIVSSKSNTAAINQAVNIAQASRIPAGLTRRKDALMGQLLNAYYLTPPDLRRTAVKLYAAWPTARDSMLRISERLKEASGGFGAPYDADLISVIEAHGDDALKDWIYKNPHASDSLKTLSDLLKERKVNSEWMAKHGLASIDYLEMARNAGEEAEYLTMMYNVDLLKGKYTEWVTKNHPKLMDDAVDELTRGGRNAWEVESELARIMRQSDPESAFSTSSLVDNTAFGKLRHRGDWHRKYPKVAKLMGPVPSGSLRLGHSIGYQRAIKAQVSTWDAIQQTKWWSPGPRPDLTLHIPNEARFGNARGGYTHKSLENFIAKKPEDAANEAARMFGWMGGKWKSFNTVYGGPTPWINNILRNLKGIAISGGYQGVEDIYGFSEAPRMLLGWRENPSMLGPFALVGEAKEFSALSSGFAGAEIYDAKKRIQDELLRAMSRTAGSGTPMEDAVMVAQDFMRKNTENIKDAYDAIDQYFKMATYLNLRKRYIGQGHSVHDAAAHASEDINAAYPNFELPGPLVERNRGKWGWVAPFLSSKAEDMRITAMTAARIARTGKLAAMDIAHTMLPEGSMRAPDMSQGDPALALRMAAFGAVIYGAVGTMRALARSNGITAQDEEDARNSMTLKRQSWSPMMVPMWDYDDKGRLQFIDMTPIEDTFMMLRGNPNDPLAARLFLNNWQDLVGDDTYLGRGPQSLMNAGGLISDPNENPFPIVEGEGGVINILGDYARSGGVPQFPIRAYDAWKRTQSNEMNPADEPWTNTQGLLKGAGLPIGGPVGEGTYMGSALEGKSRVRKIRGQARGVPRRIGGDDQERFDYLIDSKVRGLGAVQDRLGGLKVPKTVSPSNKGGNK